MRLATHIYTRLGFQRSPSFSELFNNRHRDRPLCCLLNKQRREHSPQVLEILKGCATIFSIRSTHLQRGRARLARVFALSRACPTEEVKQFRHFRQQPKAAWSPIDQALTTRTASARATTLRLGSAGAGSCGATAEQQRLADQAMINQPSLQTSPSGKQPRAIRCEAEAALSCAAVRVV